MPLQRDLWAYIAPKPDTKKFVAIIMPLGAHKRPVHLKPLRFECIRLFSSQDAAKRELEWLFGKLEWQPAGASQIKARIPN